MIFVVYDSDNFTDTVGRKQQDIFDMQNLTALTFVCLKFGMIDDGNVKIHFRM